MNDIEILRAVGISTYLYDKPNNSLHSMIVKAMAQARADERVKMSREIYASCENLSDYTVVFGGTNDLRDVPGDKK